MTWLFAGFTLAGGMQTRSPVAIGSRNDLDGLASGAPSCAVPASATRAVADSGDPVLVSKRRF
jgi:hypothetical protein